MRQPLSILLILLSTTQFFAQITFKEHTVLAFHSAGATYVDTGDIDGDGDIDIVGAGTGNSGTPFYGSSFVWFENNNTDVFSVHVIDTDSLTARGKVSADLIDFDNDGDLDIVGFARVSNSYQWYENDGTGNFTTHLIDNTEKIDNPIYIDPYSDPDYDPGADPYFNPGADPQIDQYGQPEYFIADRLMVLAIDFDRDGDIDLVGAASNMTLWYENDGNLNFTRHFLGDIRSISISCADIDGDGDLDLISGNRWYINNGSQEFNNSLVIIDHNSKFSFSGLRSAVDLDQDNDIDFIVFSYNESFFSWLENDGSGNFTEHIINDDNYYTDDATSISYQDVDLDGDIDILGTGNNDTSSFIWFENNGNQEFIPHIIASGYNFDGLAYGAQNLISADIDADGDMDIIGAADNDDAYSFYINDGDQRFNGIRLSNDNYQANEPNYVSSGDIDNDGDIDIFGSSGGGDNYSWFENDGSGNFITHLIERSLFKSRNPRGLEVADINNDGNLDFVGSSYWTGQYSWFENDGKGNFTQHDVVSSSNEPDFDDPIGDALNVVDIDQDGDMDILALSLGGVSKILWFKNDGNGGFTKNFISENLPASQRISYLRAADFDNDGDVDLLSKYTVDYTNSVFVWLENDGDQNFNYQVIDNNMRNTSIEIADINNDGNVDIVTGSYDNGFKANLYLNDGFKNFNKTEILNDLVRTRSIRSLTDLNNDGHIDIVGSTYNETYLYLNNGLGTFNERILVGGEILDADIADINGDCINDIIAARGVENDVEINAFAWYEIDGISLVNTEIVEQANNLISQANNVQYQWIDCGNGNTEIFGETNRSFTPSSNGNYAVTLIFDDCIERSPCFNYNSASLSTIDKNLIESIKVYPNPSNGEIFIVSNNNIEKIEIINALGQRLITKQSNNARMELTIKSKGFYILKIFSKDGMTEKKIIVN